MTRSILLLAPIAGWLTLAAHGYADTTDAGVVDASITTSDAQRARAIRALAAGALDVRIDPRDLFREDLGQGGARVAFVRQLLGTTAKDGRIDYPKNMAGETRALWEARREFLALPATEQSRLLSLHASRQRQAAERARANDEVATNRERLQRRIRGLQAFLQGRLASSADAAALFKFDLLDSYASLPVVEKKALLASLERYQALSQDERQALFDQHAKQPAPPKSAVPVNGSPTPKATDSKPSDRTQLEVRKQQLADFALLLSRSESNVRARSGLVDEWRRRVSAVAPGDTREADAVYSGLVDELTQARRRLTEALDGLHAASRLLRAQPGPASADGALSELRRELQQQAQTLVRREAAVRWATTTVLRDSIVALNQERLRLFSRLSPRRRSALMGFGVPGRAQLRRELEQISLELRYQYHALPHVGRRLRAEAAADPARSVLLVLKLLLVCFLFVQWRRRSSPFLQEVRSRQLAKRPQTRPGLFVAAAIWYGERVRGPMEWLLCLYVLGRVLPPVPELPILQLVWLIAIWLFVGSFAIRLLDAIAARRPVASATNTDRLRFRSLRLVGMTVVVVGLVLSIADVFVGRGAIYSWIWRSCWVLVVPVSLVLLRWWKPIIYERARAHPTPNRMLKWTLAHQGGLSGVFAPVVGGIALLTEGVLRFCIEQLSHLAVTRRMLAHLFRREVEKQAASRNDDARVRKLPDEVHERLAPDTKTDVVVGVSRDSIEHVRDLIRADNNTVVAVVGERGLGKTDFLSRILEGGVPSYALSLECQPGGFSALRRSIAEAIETTASDEKTLVAALQARRPTVICIDDAHRLVRPLIGGLKDIDQLVAFAHQVGPSTSWVVAIDAPAWRYLRRARGDRAIFDEVVMLPRWSEEQIRELVLGRAEESSLSPSFDDLIVPRQMYDVQYSAKERTERDYSRILWDYSDGNPSVALQFWRESLAVRDERVVVRLFKTPAVTGLEGLPGSMHFVLRAIIQLELANERDIASCTNLHAADVADALRVARARGYIDEIDGHITISLHWFRAITRFLKRQHLLVGDDAR